jgi:hypothetical protein
MTGGSKAATIGFGPSVERGQVKMAITPTAIA